MEPCPHKAPRRINQEPRRSDLPSLPSEAESPLRLNFLHRMALVKTILVVDDEPQIITLVRDYLEHGGFSVFTAADGPTALRTASTQHPDLVVLDLGLPGIDGLDVTRSLRLNGTVPIIVLTARTAESDQRVGSDLCVDHDVNR